VSKTILWKNFDPSATIDLSLPSSLIKRKDADLGKQSLLKTAFPACDHAEEKFWSSFLTKGINSDSNHIQPPVSFLQVTGSCLIMTLSIDFECLRKEEKKKNKWVKLTSVIVVYGQVYDELEEKHKTIQRLVNITWFSGEWFFKEQGRKMITVLLHSVKRSIMVLLFN
jgi:hypothetical protein